MVYSGFSLLVYSYVCNSFGFAFTIYSSTGDHLKVPKLLTYSFPVMWHAYFYQGNLTTV